LMDNEVLKTTFTMSSAAHTQNISTQISFKEYTAKLLLRYKHLEYARKFIMRPLENYFPIHITNNVITINNPNKHSYGFAIDYDYRIIPFHSHKKGNLPMRIWLPLGKHSIELTKKFGFGTHVSNMLNGCKI